MRFTKLHSGVLLAFFLSLQVVSAQTNRTWTGSMNMDWFNPGNWSPAGVPASNDIVNLTNGTIVLTAPVTVNGLFNWTGGTLSGDALTIASNGVLNINGPATTLYLENPLTNAGTVTWSNNCTLIVDYGSGLYFGLIENLAGGLFDIQSDQSMYNSAGGLAYFQNAGTLRKSAGTGTTTISIPIYNSGTVTALQGTLDLNGGGTVTGTYGAASGAAIHFSAGDFTNSGPVSINGPGAVQLTSGTLLLPSDVIANLALTGGTVNLGQGFQGGTITNLTIAGATLAGTNTVTGTFNWSNGTIAGGPLTVASNGVLNVNGPAATMYLESPLTNSGTVTWSNNCTLLVINGAGIYFGLIENLAGGLFDIQSDQSMYNSAGGPAYFHNAGTLRKSANSGMTSISIPIFNSTTVTALQGTLNFNGGGTLAGTFASASGAAIDFSGGNFTNSGPATMTGPGMFQFTSGNLLLQTDVISNLALSGGTVNLGPAFQGGTITNLTIAGATLAGTNTVTGTFNWSNGTISGGPLTIASNAVMHINGAGSMYLENPLTNSGTVTWSNVGTLDVINGAGIYFGLIENLAGGLFDIQSDESLFNNAGGPAYFHNAGTLQKSGLTGSTAISIPVTNSGTIAALHGNIALVGGFTPVGGSLVFGMSSPTDFGTMSIYGNAALGGTAGVVWLNGFVPAYGNSFTVLTYGSFSGGFTNYNLPPAAIWVITNGPTALTFAIGSINKVVFTSQPASGKITNQFLPPVVVQVEDPVGNPQSTNGVPITLSLVSGTGKMSGTSTQNTDVTGKATFGDLRFDLIGTKTLLATAPGLTATNSAIFQIVPVISEQWTNGNLLLQLNGSNNLGPVVISASSNLVTWLPIYTNAPTNGPILYLDTSASNYPTRFYRISE